MRLTAVHHRDGETWLELSGVDFLDRTPVIDIKPYIPYSDSIAEASGGYADGRRTKLPVLFEDEPAAFCRRYREETGRNLGRLIEEMIRHDPRPASQRGTKNSFGMLLWDVNVRWLVAADCFRVEECRRMDGENAG